MEKYEWIWVCLFISAGQLYSALIQLNPDGCYQFSMVLQYIPYNMDTVLLYTPFLWLYHQFFLDSYLFTHIIRGRSLALVYSNDWLIVSEVTLTRKFY